MADLDRQDCTRWWTTSGLVELAILDAAVDDEPETEEERAAVGSTIKDPARGIPLEQLRKART